MKDITVLQCRTTTMDRTVAKVAMGLVVISKSKKVSMILPFVEATAVLAVPVDVAEVAAHDADAERRLKSRHFDHKDSRNCSLIVLFFLPSSAENNQDDENQEQQQGGAGSAETNPNNNNGRPNSNRRRRRRRTNDEGSGAEQQNDG
jgi:hypothetical protein